MERALKRPDLRVCMISLGCAKNLADSEAMIGQALAAAPGASVCSEPAEADIVIVNTCGFLRAARDEADETIATMEALRAQDPAKRIIVVGCYPQLWRDQVLRRHPGVDTVLGVDALYQTEFWSNLLTDATPRDHPVPVTNRIMRDFEAPRLLGGSAFAYLKIGDGCSQRCAYCTIPLIKGPLVSRSMDVVLREADDLACAGVKEIILVAQNTSAYGMDMAPRGKPKLAELLRELDDVAGIEILRVLYLYPTLVSNQILETIAASRHVAHYIDMPLQHTEPAVLRAMGRPWAAGLAKRLVARIRRIMPDAGIRSTFMVGFPGETEQCFRELLDELEELQLDHAGAFAYSREPMTPSYDFAQHVPWSMKHRRLREFMERQQQISLSVNRNRYLGKTISIIVDDVDSSRLAGRTFLDAPDVDNTVWAPVGKTKRPATGDICRVLVTACGPYDLDGVLV